MLSAAEARAKTLKFRTVETFVEKTLKRVSESAEKGNFTVYTSVPISWVTASRNNDGEELKQFVSTMESLGYVMKVSNHEQDEIYLVRW